MYYLGYDIGSSSIKAALVDGDTNETVEIVQYPETEMPIVSPNPGWAEQDPDLWWENVKHATNKLFQDRHRDLRKEVKGIGISYQMHGLVLVDKDYKPIRPSIIWCDSRAIQAGEEGVKKLGEKKCFRHLLNTPGNFTASKLRWVRDHEPEAYERIHKIMLPGDYVALKMTGQSVITPSGLSEGIMWDFIENRPAKFMFDEFGIEEGFLPDIRDTCSVQGEVTKETASILGIPEGTPVGYRAGDQPNNAMSLGVLNPGEVAATGGTSGVVYGVLDQPIYDDKSRVNGFAHVNHTSEKTRIGVLLCINGSGIQYSWIRQQMAGATPYRELEKMANEISIGSQGLMLHPFGNGAERMLNNREPGAHVSGLNFNRHDKRHFFRASLEGIAFSFAYGLDILKEMGIRVTRMSVGNDNLFQSSVFSNTISTLMNATIDIIETTGAAGAAKAVGYTLKHRSSLEEAMTGQNKIKTLEPNGQLNAYQDSYDKWKNELDRILNN